MNGTAVIPTDNPFVNDPTTHDALWITGLRNPWKFSMLSDGRILIADVDRMPLKKYPLPRKETIWDGMSGKGIRV